MSNIIDIKSKFKKPVASPLVTITDKYNAEVARLEALNSNLKLVNTTLRKDLEIVLIENKLLATRLEYYERQKKS